MKVGDEVYWDSQSGGHLKEKHGIIIKTVEANKHIETNDWLEYKIMFSDGDQRSPKTSCERNHESYLVMVKSPGNGKPFLYWPQVSKLRVKLQMSKIQAIQAADIAERENMVEKYPMACRVLARELKLIKKETGR